MACFAVSLHACNEPCIVSTLQGAASRALWSHIRRATRAQHPVGTWCHAHTHSHKLAQNSPALTARCMQRTHRTISSSRSFLFRAAGLCFEGDGFPGLLAAFAGVVGDVGARSAALAPGLVPDLLWPPENSRAIPCCFCCRSYSCGVGEMCEGWVCGGVGAFNMQQGSA